MWVGLLDHAPCLVWRTRVLHCLATHWKPVCHGRQYQQLGCHQRNFQVHWYPITQLKYAFHMVEIFSRRYLFVAYANNGNVCFVQRLLHLGQCGWKLWVLWSEAISGNCRLHSGETAVTVCCFVSLFCFWEMWIFKLASLQVTMVKQWEYEIPR